MDFKTAYPDSYSTIKQNAKDNRSMMTDAERYLWNYIKNEQIGVRFRRQHIIGDYIVDFICLKQKLIIEVDGGYHNNPTQQQKDRIIQNWLESMGYKVLRFNNNDIFHQIESVITIIKQNISIDLPFKA
jgi:very-short-patch-repair endonuclease